MTNPSRIPKHKPAIRVADSVIFPDGSVRKLTLYERFRIWTGHPLPTAKRKGAKHGSI